MKRKCFITIMALVTIVTGAWAQEFISEVKLIGGSLSEVNEWKSKLKNQGWTIVESNLNSGTRGDYIYLCYKKAGSNSASGTYITDLYLRCGSGRPNTLTSGGRTYTLCPYEGGSHFKAVKGDLNSNCGGDDINLYYTKATFNDRRAVTRIWFNSSSSGAVVKEQTSTPYDLNTGVGGDDIYMHFSTAVSSTSTTPTTPTTAGGPSSYIAAPQNLEAYRNKVGQSFTFLVTAAYGGSIWGGKNYIYSDNSDLATACRHSVLGKNHTNKVIVKILADQGSYPSYKHNGITSSQRGAWKGAYQIIGIPRTYVTSTDMSKYRNFVYEQVVVRVTGRRTGTVYGKNTGWGYMDKSDLSTAAVHAGILKDGQTAYLTVRIGAGSPRYDAAKMNNIQSRSYGKGEGTFKIVKASQTCPSNLSAATIR